MKTSTYMTKKLPPPPPPKKMVKLEMPIEQARILAVVAGSWSMNDIYRHYDERNLKRPSEKEIDNFHSDLHEALRKFYE